MSSLHPSDAGRPLKRSLLFTPQPPAPYKHWREYRRVVLQAMGTSCIRYLSPVKGPHCFCPGTIDYAMDRLVEELWVLLGHNPRPAESELEHALTHLGFYVEARLRRSQLRRRYRRRYGEMADAPRLSTHPIELAAAGKPDGPRRFRSVYERRTAEALTRLGVRWEFEPEHLAYRDWKGRHRWYIPDFALVDFHRTFVEVKGPSGANAGDEAKMRAVLAAHPYLTLLLWDAALVDYVEDIDDPAFLIGLLRTTRFGVAA